MNTFPGFPPETLQFLRELKENNNRQWFLAHKTIYTEKVREPLVQLIQALKPRIRKFAPELLLDPAKCIFRIYRDIRFSADKSPYKTNIAASFNPRELQGRSCAGLYFHLDPEQVLLGGGMYMPGPVELLAVRSLIARHPVKFRKIIHAPKFKRLFGELRGEKLSRIPKGFSRDHPSADLLRFKQFLAFVTMPPRIAETPRLVTEIVRYFLAMMPLVRFLNSPLRRMGRRLRNF